jgi:hypothetical protein
MHRQLEMEEKGVVLRRYRVMLRRAGYLPVRDQTLLRLAVLGEHGYRELGRIMGMTAGSAYRRVERLKRRLRDPVVAALIDYPGTLSEEYRELGLRHFLLKRAARTLAAERGECEQDMKAKLRCVRVWARKMGEEWGEERHGGT